MELAVICSKVNAIFFGDAGILDAPETIDKGSIDLILWSRHPHLPTLTLIAVSKSSGKGGNIVCRLSTISLYYREEHNFYNDCLGP